MYRGAWLTPDAVPTSTKCIQFEVPDDPAFEAMIRGALALLFDSYNFEKYGTLTPEETADVFLEFMDSWMAWVEITC